MNRNGQTLPEIVIAILLIALVASGIFAVMLTARQGTTATEKKEDLLLEGNKLSQELKAYVTDDPAAPNGPGADSAHSWWLSGDPCTGIAGAPYCWALETTPPGAAHDATALLPAALANAPFNARMTYTVAPTAVNGFNLRRVDVQLKWDVPQT